MWSRKHTVLSRETSDKMLRLFPALFDTHHGPYSKPWPFLFWTISRWFPYLFPVCLPRHLPFHPPHFSIICQRGSPFMSQTLDSSMLTFLSLLSYTTLRPVVAGPSQAFLVFNFSYVWRLSLRLDLLYQYQVIASEVPCNRYTTDFLSCEPPILRPIAWLHRIPLSYARRCDFIHLEMQQAGLTDTWLTLTRISLLTRIRLQLHLELGHNTRHGSLDSVGE